MSRLVLLLLLVLPTLANAQCLDDCPPPQLQPVQPVEPQLGPRTVPRRTNVFHVSLAVGAGFRELYGVSYGVGNAQLLLGADREHFGMYAELVAEAGAPELRLPIGGFAIGMLFQGIYGRWRFGGGFRLGGIFVGRATTQETAGGFAVDVYAMGSVDVLKWRDHALWLGVDVGADFNLFSVPSALGFDGDVAPSVTLRLGVRL